MLGVKTPPLIFTLHILWTGDQDILIEQSSHLIVEYSRSNTFKAVKCSTAQSVWQFGHGIFFAYLNGWISHPAVALLTLKKLCLQLNSWNVVIGAAVSDIVDISRSASNFLLSVILYKTYTLYPNFILTSILLKTATSSMTSKKKISNNYCPRHQSCMPQSLHQSYPWICIFNITYK